MGSEMCIRDSYNIVLDNLLVSDSDGHELLDLESVQLNCSPGELFSARLWPRRIILDGMTVDLVRRANRRLRLDYGVQEGASREQTNITQILENSAYFREIFESAKLKNATLLFSDEASGRRWESQNAEASVIRTANGYEAIIDADFDLEGQPSHLKLAALLNEDTSILDASIDVKDAPVSDLLEIFYGPGAAILTAPVTGTAHISMTQDGEVLSSSIDGVAQDGMMHLAGTETKVRQIEVKAKFDPEGNKFTVQQLILDTDRITGNLSGIVGVDFQGAIRAPSMISFDVESDEIKVFENGQFPEPVDIDRALVKGHYVLATRELDISDLTLDVFGVAAKGTANFERPHGTDSDTGSKKDPSPSVSAAVSYTHLTLPTICSV